MNIAMQVTGSKRESDGVAVGPQPLLGWGGRAGGGIITTGREGTLDREAGVSRRCAVPANVYEVV